MNNNHQDLYRLLRPALRWKRAANQRAALRLGGGICRKTGGETNPLVSHALVEACACAEYRNMADLVALFTSIGLSEQKAKETLKNEQLTSALRDAVIQVSLRSTPAQGFSSRAPGCRASQLVMLTSALSAVTVLYGLNKMKSTKSNEFQCS